MEIFNCGQSFQAELSVLRTFVEVQARMKEEPACGHRWRRAESDGGNEKRVNFPKEAQPDISYDYNDLWFAILLFALARSPNCFYFVS